MTRRRYDLVEQRQQLLRNNINTFFKTLCTDSNFLRNERDAFHYAPYLREVSV